MCTVLLPPGDNPITVNKYIISIQLSLGGSSPNTSTDKTDKNK